MGARTDAARAQVVEARSGVEEELVRLEAAGRAAIDIPARLRRDPLRVGGAAAGLAFLVAGGPKRLLRRLRRAVLGERADLPPSLLPEQVERALRRLGPDGDRVRGALEREFARYLDDTAPARRRRDLLGTLSHLAGNVLGPASVRAGRRLAEQLFDPDGPSFEAGLRKARERVKDERRAG
jgi:hypothetical protein